MGTHPSSMARLASPSARSARIPVALPAYGAVALVATALGALEGRCPLVVEPWLPLGEGGPDLYGHAASVVAGLLVAGATVRLTPALVNRWGRARALHAALRPSLRHASSASLALGGIASAVAEELLFRGALAPLVGVVLSSVAFGLLHQIGGRGRWIWAGWAALMGTTFALLFLATGSLLGPLVGHALINVKNARFLRDTAIEPERRLGGLLRAP